MRALTELLQSSGVDSIEWVGIGGEKMRAAGLTDSLVSAEHLRVMGFFELLPKLAELIGALQKAKTAIASSEIDLAIVIDSPDFHFRLFESIAGKKIPLVYFIPPKIWAWRAERLEKLRRYCQLILCVLPFEKEIYDRAGVPARYVGHPSIEQLDFSLSQSQARSVLGVASQDCVIGLLPGSRRFEIEQHFEVMVRAALAQVQSLGERDVRVLVAPARQEDAVLMREMLGSLGLGPRGSRVQVLDARVGSFAASELVLRASDGAIVKSGTSTLEAGLLGCRHLIIYRPKWLSLFFVKFWVKYSGPVGLVNLFIDGPWGKTEITEVLSEECTQTRLSIELKKILTDRVEQDRQTRFFETLTRVATQDLDKSPSFNAARAIGEMWNSHQRGHGETDRPTVVNEAVSLANQAFTTLASVVWGALNWLNRYLHSRGFFKVDELGTKVISVGNLEVGGTGKTPLVAMIAKRALQERKKVGVLTRGYRAQFERQGIVIEPGSRFRVADIGDEPAVLRQLLPEVTLFVGANRQKIYSDYVLKTGKRFDLLILDDGFQHCQIARDLNCVAWAGNSGAGRLFRDFTGALANSDLVFWTKGVLPPPVRKGFAPVVRLKTRSRMVVGSNDQLGSFFLVSGVGRFEDLKMSVTQSGFTVGGEKSLDDHHAYTASEVEGVQKAALLGKMKLLTTLKDWVKLVEVADEVLQHELWTVVESNFEFETRKDEDLWNHFWQKLWS